MKFLLAGSIPLIFSCILEAWFKVDGTVQTLYGLISWFFYVSIEGVSGLFNNQNYTGVWLNVILAFLLFEIKNNQKKFISKSFLIIFVLLTIYFLILTNSRNSFIGMILTFIISINPIKLLISIPIFSSIIIILKELIIKIFFAGIKAADPESPHSIFYKISTIFQLVI